MVNLKYVLVVKNEGDDDKKAWKEDINENVLNGVTALSHGQMIVDTFNEKRKKKDNKRILVGVEIEGEESETETPVKYVRKTGKNSGKLNGNHIDEAIIDDEINKEAAKKAFNSKGKKIKFPENKGVALYKRKAQTALEIISTDTVKEKKEPETIEIEEAEIVEKKEKKETPKIEKRANFSSPMNLACADDDLRPALNCVHFVKGFAYATNGKILAKQSLEYSNIEQVEKLEGKSIHKDSYKQIMNFQYATAEDSMIVCIDENGRKAEFFYAHINEIPDFEKQLPVDDSRAVSFIGINPEFITIAGKILHGSKSGMKLEFYGIDKGIVMTTMEYENQLVYAMPILLEPTLF
jgi:hypothetical protein